VVLEGAHWSYLVGRILSIPCWISLCTNVDICGWGSDWFSVCRSDVWSLILLPQKSMILWTKFPSCSSPLYSACCASSLSAKISLLHVMVLLCLFIPKTMVQWPVFVMFSYTIEVTKTWFSWHLTSGRTSWYLMNLVLCIMTLLSCFSIYVLLGWWGHEVCCNKLFS
jgi:hypothetical protein